MVGFRQKEISNLATYYQEHSYTSEEEKEKAINECSPFRRSIKLQMTQRTNLFEIYTDLLRESKEDMKNINVILNLMLVISTSAAAAERGFSKLNIKKTSLHTRLNSKTLSNKMHTGIENIPVTKFDSRPILNDCQCKVNNTLEDTKQKTKKT